MFSLFSRDRRGSVTILFAFALVPLLIVGGAAIEYSRSTRLQADLQSAVDGAALTAGRNALDEGRRDPAKLARDAFDAAFRSDGGITLTRFLVTQSSDRIAVEAAATLPTIFGGFLGKRAVDLGAKAEVPLGIMALEVALVLDNTGSMSRLGKMDALKEAAKNLLDTIQVAAGNVNASFALVPFNTQVNVGMANSTASWLRFTPGSPEPNLDVTSAAWTGCVSDRDQPEDVRDTIPSTGRPATLHPAAKCQFAGLQTILPLSRDFAAIKTAVDAMTPTGNTNTGIGLAWGLVGLDARSGAEWDRASAERAPPEGDGVPDRRPQHREPVDQGPGADRSAHRPALRCDQGRQDQAIYDPRHRGERDHPAQLRQQALDVLLGQPSLRAQGCVRQNRGRADDAAPLVLNRHRHSGRVRRQRSHKVQARSRTVGHTRRGHCRFYGTRSADHCRSCLSRLTASCQVEYVVLVARLSCRSKRYS